MTDKDRMVTMCGLTDCVSADHDGVGCSFYQSLFSQGSWLIIGIAYLPVILVCLCGLVDRAPARSVKKSVF